VSTGVSCFAQLVDKDIFGIKHKELIKKNNVRFVLGWTYEYNNGKQERIGKKSSFEKFDKEGNLIEEVYYKQNGESNFECTHLYNVTGWEISTVEFKSGAYSNKRWLNGWEEKERLLTKIPFKALDSKEKWSFRYDSKGNRVEEIKYDEDGGIAYSIYLKYDNNDNVIEKLELDGNNNLFEKWIYVNDEKGNNIEATQYDSDNKLFYKYTFSYDYKGNKTDEIIYDSAGEPKQRTKFVYQQFTW